MNILIVNTGRFGDIIQSVPLIRGLKKKYNHCKIYYLLIENFKPAAELNNEIDEIISVNFSEILKFIDFNNFEYSFRKIKSFFKNIPQDFQLLINLSFSKLSALISALISAKDKRGFIFTKNNEFIAPDNWSKFFLAIVDFREFSPFNLVDIFSKIGGVNSSKVLINEPSSVENIGFQMGASSENRRWPARNFAELARIIHQNKKDAKIYLFGSKSEKGLGEEFERYYKSDNVVNLIGKTSIKDLYNHIKENIDVLVTNDTGTMHLAWFSNKKVIELSLGPALYNTTGPYGDGHIIVQPDVECSPCSYQIDCRNLKCHNLIKPALIFKLIFNLNVQDISDVKIFKSYYDENNYLSYKKISGNDDIFTMKRDKLKFLWISLIEDNVNFNNFQEKKDLDEINQLINEILKNIHIIFNEKNSDKIILHWEKIANYEKIIKNLIFSEFKYFIPFFKYFEFLKNFNESKDFTFLLKNYELAVKKLKFSLNNFS